MARGEVVSQKRDVNGNPIGRENANPIIYSRWYEVEFDNGEVAYLTVNAIAERMYAQCDKDGYDMLLIYSFIDYHKSERSMSLQYQQITVNGRACKKRLTYGWEICGLWKNQSTNWERLDYLK